MMFAEIGFSFNGNQNSSTKTAIETHKHYTTDGERHKLMEVNAVNENGFTALDIIQQMPRDMKGTEIRDYLLKAGGIISCTNMPAAAASMGEKGINISMVIEENPQIQLPPPPTTYGCSQYRSKRRCMDGKSKSKSSENKKEWMEKKRDALMIAATLITGMTFQMVVNPPGGLWDEDKVVVVVAAAAAGGGTGRKMLTGTWIMAHWHPEYYELFMAYNSMSFLGSLSEHGVHGIQLNSKKK